MALISTLRRTVKRAVRHVVPRSLLGGLLGVARHAYRLLPLPEPAKKRLRFFLKTRLGVLFGRRRAWSYARWVRTFDTLTAADARALGAWVHGLTERPRFTVIVPVPAGGQARRHALACLASVRTQLFPDVECRVTGPGADAALLRDALPAGADSVAARWQVVAARPDADAPAEQEGVWLREGIAAAGTPWLALLRHDAVLAPDALALVAATLQTQPRAALLYGDEDRLSERGAREEPWFKPQFDEDLLLAQDYLGPLLVLRRDALERAGGMAAGGTAAESTAADGTVAGGTAVGGTAAAYAVALQVAAAAVVMAGGSAAEIVRRVPFVLAHRQAGALPVPPEPRRRVVQRYLSGRGAAVAGVDVLATGDLRVRYALDATPPLVTLIVPTRDRADLLRTCLAGLLRETDYPALEVIVVDNRSREPATFAAFRALEADPRVRILPYDAPFDFSRMNNLAAREARGAVLGLINNDIAVISPDWLREMVAQALRPGVGAVGAKLVYGDGTIQHAGIVLGLLGLAGHVCRHWPGEAPGPGRRLTVVHTVTAVTGACLVVRKALYLDAGGLDESMPVSCSDVDLCLRLAARGHRTVFTPHAVLHHLESVSRGYERSAAQWAETRREEALLRERWGRLLLDDPAYSPNLSLDSEHPSPAVPPRVKRPWRAE
jgi:GT2 family glycosyltransferase